MELIRGKMKRSVSSQGSTSSEERSPRDCDLEGVSEVRECCCNEPQDADYSYIPMLSDELALLVLARIPRCDHMSLSLVNKRYLALVKSGELFNVRREIRNIHNVLEPSVFMFASGVHHWWSYYPCCRRWRKLPDLPSDSCFFFGDKESLCVGTDLLVTGHEIEGRAVWRYDLSVDSWHRGPLMIDPRCLFASANCGDVACIAGGIGMDNKILSSAEMYDQKNKTWVSLPRMNNRRKLCSGCFMDNKFYVLGGVNEDGCLVSGESYNPEKKVWEMIPGMANDLSSSSSQSPPLIAVVDNELYALETATNQLKVYMKASNSWRVLGRIPVRVDLSKGWGVAFKSMGDRLLMVGAAWSPPEGEIQSQGISIFTCRPDPDGEDCEWEFQGMAGNFMGPFVFNCSVMFA